jgi:hypothetical protein
MSVSGNRLQHDPHPVYLGVALDRTLNYREHLSRSAAKLKSRNNLLMICKATSKKSAILAVGGHFEFLMTNI